MIARITVAVFKRAFLLFNRVKKPKTGSVKAYGRLIKGGFTE